MSNKITAIRGMRDILPPETRFWQNVEKLSQKIFSTYGFDEIRTPIVETAELFIRSVGEESEVVNKQMYIFMAGDEKLALRPEGTASVVRAYIENGLCMTAPVSKFYYMGPMFRHERPQKGRQRQFHQIGAEVFGVNSASADAEIIALSMDILKAIGLTNIRLEINSIGNKESRKNYNQALVEYFKKSEKDLSDDSKKRLCTNPMRILDSKDEKDKKIVESAPSILDYLSNESAKHFETVKSLLDKTGLKYIVNERIVRGLDYYEETAFEIISEGLGSQNAVAGGGRYNGLVKDLGGPDIAGVGFAIGLDRALLAIPQVEIKKDMIFVAVLDEELVLDAFDTIQKLRKDNVRVEWDYASRSLKAQMKKADKLGAESIIIFGKDEFKDGNVIIRNMKDGQQKSVAIKDIALHFVNIGG